MGGGRRVAHLVEDGLGDLAHLLLYVVFPGKAVGEHQTHVGSLAQLAALVLRQVAEGGDGIGLGCLLEDPAEGRDGFGELDEEADCRVAVEQSASEGLGGGGVSDVPGDFSVAGIDAAGAEVRIDPEQALGR